MQSFCPIVYLNIMKAIRHLPLLALLAGAQAFSPLPSAGETSVLPTGDTYAVIVSGGCSPTFNHERYWNDCAFIYRVLRRDCHLPQSHITLLMADGDDPSPDMLLDRAAGFASSPTDLDGDGLPDLTLAATRQNLDDTFRRLSSELTAADRLFLFITDHGERDSDGTVHLSLWGGGRLTPDELATMVSTCHPATMSILLGQCYAGAFATALLGEGRVVTAACASDQLSWACKDRCHDEFVYHWTCAIAHHDEQGQYVDADTDGNGLVSMAEAYGYARRHDRRPETPFLICLPDGLADKWAMGSVQTENAIGQTSISKPASQAIYDLHGRKKQ